MEYDWVKIGQRIRENRKALPKGQNTLEHFAEEIHCRRQTVSEWEKGKAEPLLRDVLNMCRLFDCESGYLLCEFDTKTRITAEIQSATGLRESAIKKLAAYQAEKPEVVGEFKGENETVIPMSYFINYGEQLFQMMRAERTNHFEYLRAKNDELFPLFQRLYGKAAAEERKRKSETWGMNTDVEKAYAELVKAELQQQGKSAEDIQRIYQKTMGFYYDSLRLKNEELSRKNLMIYELYAIVEKYVQEG